MKKLNFKTVSGKQFSLEVDPETTFDVVTKLVGDELRVLPSLIKIVYISQTVPLSRKISDLSIRPNTVLVVHCRTHCRLKPKSGNPVHPPALSKEVQSLSKKHPKEDSDIFDLSDTSLKFPQNASNSPEMLQQKSINSPFLEKLALPPRSNFHRNFPNTEHLVSSLVNLGFEQDCCEKALQLSDYNLSRATELLISGLPSSPKTEDFSELQASALHAFKSQLIRSAFPDQTSNSRNSFACCSYDTILNGAEKPTPKELDDLLELERKGFERESIVQVFYACDRNIELTEACLLTMK